jgi:hypothetical protein
MTILEALAQAHEAGYFERAKQGDDRAASYFVRYAAQLANPNGADRGSWGVLRKGGGKNIDGYAEDALVFGSSSSDLHNVYDFVLGAGANGARVNYGAGPVNRRDSDKWEAPRPLNGSELAYIGATSNPPPPPPPPPPNPPTQPPPPPPPTVDLSGVIAKIESMNKDVVDAITASREAANEVKNLLLRMEQGARIDASINVRGRLSGTVKF